jgi:pyruvate/2-oxoglutarate dehydrogenase complex dihydrolipoamide acyltransferase (E2) component
MPFLYELKVSGDAPAYTFVQQLVSTGTLVGFNQPVATLTDGAMEYHVPAPRQGLFVEWFVEHGAVIERGDPIARLVCDGEQVDVTDAVPMRLG